MFCVKMFVLTVFFVILDICYGVTSQGHRTSCEGLYVHATAKVICGRENLRRRNQEKATSVHIKEPCFKLSNPQTTRLPLVAHQKHDGHCIGKRYTRKNNQTEKAKILTLPIGTIFNPKDQQARSAFRLAKDMFNRKKESPFKLALYVDITDVSDNYKLANAICSKMSDGVFLFYGMKNIVSKDIVEDYTGRFHMPYISPSLSKVVTKPNTTFQIHMKPSFTSAIIDMIRHYQWNFIAYLYDSDEGLQRYHEITKHYETLEAEFLFHRLCFVDQVHEALRHLDRAMIGMPAAIILDLSSQEAYSSVLRQIAEVGMNKHGYFYLLATMDFSKLEFQRFLHGGVNLTGFDLVVQREDSTKLKSFTKEWMSASNHEYAGAGTQITAEVAMAVDAVELIVKTLARMLNENKVVFQQNFRRGKMYNSNYSKSGIPCNKMEVSDPPPIPWMHGINISRELKETQFEGLTGNVEFDSDGFRTNYMLHVTTVGQDNGPVTIGTWKPEYGYSSLFDDGMASSHNETTESIKRICTILSPPFLMREEVKDDGKPLFGNDRFKGYAADLSKAVANIIPFDYVLLLVKDGKYGIKNETSQTWNGILGELQRGDADLAIADLTITYDREKEVDFTKPFMNVGISIMIKKPDIEKPGVFSFMQPLELTIWLCILIAYAAVSVGLFFVSRFSPYEWKKIDCGKVPEFENEFSLLNSFWFSTGALMLQGSDTCPRSMSGRIIGTVWWFFVLIIISTYTANLAAFLTIERMVAPIESADDLAKQTDIKYGTIKDGSTRKFFETSKVPVYQTMWHFMSTQPNVLVESAAEGIEKVRNSKGKYAFLLESSSNAYTNSREPCDTIKVGRNLNSKGFGIATPATPAATDLRDEINLAVLELKEKGDLHKLQQKWWQDKSQCAPDGASKDSGGKRSLSLSNVAGVFYILIGGLVSAVVLGAVEFTMKKLRLVPKVPMLNSSRPVYMRGTETATSLIDTPSERENGDVGDYPPHYPVDFSHDKSVRTFTYGSPQLIGFEALDDRNTHTDV